MSFVGLLRLTTVIHQNLSSIVLLSSVDFGLDNSDGLVKFILIEFGLGKADDLVKFSLCDFSIGKTDVTNRKEKKHKNMMTC